MKIQENVCNKNSTISAISSLSMNLYIIPAWYPQDENDITACFFREQAHALAERGHDVTVIHITPVSFTRAFRQPWRMSREWQDGKVRTIFHEAVIPIPAKLGRVQDRYISHIFTKIIRQQIQDDIKHGLQRPDVIHAHVSHSCAYYCLDAAQALKIPLVVTEHYSGLLLGTASAADYERVRQTILKSDAFIFVGSNFQRTICAKLGIDKKTYVIPNMIDTSLFDSTVVAPKQRDGAFTFLTACRLDANKSVDLVIKAFHEAFPRDANVKLEIAGDGVARPALEALVRDLNEQGRVHFIGAYSRTELPTIFSPADAFVLTSRIETFGIVHIEALMCGLPCIGTAGQGAEDIIDDSNGIKVEYGDEQALVNAMSLMASHPEKYNKATFRDNCIKSFSSKTITSDLGSLYRAISFVGGG